LQILRLKCTKFDFRDSAGGAYSDPADPLAGFKKSYPTSKGRGEERKGGRGGREGQGRGRD